MVGKLLLRGMLVGIVAGLLSCAFLKAVGEPQVDRAIAFETQMDEAKAKAKADEAKAKGMAVPKEEDEPELVSRPVQAGIGLFTGVSVYNVAFGGLFALAFALIYGRAGGLGPRGTSAVLSAVGFVAVYVVPNLKYPANPPSVGDPETIGIRTGLYFSMILISLIGMVAAGKLRLSLLDRFGAWNAVIAAGAFYIAAMVLAGALLPGINEVPEQFPAVVLWQFRVASFGAQLIMWTSIGLIFGALAERLLIGRSRSRTKTVPVTP
jgi:predicted cobalt transporter CbtA